MLIIDTLMNMHNNFCIILIFRWSSEPGGDLGVVFTRESSLEEVPAVLFLPNSRSLSGCSGCVRLVFWYVSIYTFFVAVD